MSNSDKRSVHRIKLQFGLELNARILSGGKTYTGHVVDYHSLSVRVVLNEPAVIEQAEQFDLYFGTDLLCRVGEPTMLRKFDDRKTFVFRLESRSRAKDRSDLRIRMKELHYGILMGKDPMRIDQVLQFKVIELSDKGCRVRSSKSNRHLVPGMLIPACEIMLPGLGAFSVNFRIMNIRETTEHLEIGAKLESQSPAFTRALRKYLLFNSDDQVLANREELAKLLKGQKDYGPILRCEQVQTPEQYKKILAVRFMAYLKAGKVDASIGEEGMIDAYDAHSAIYSIHIGNMVVGTVRLVFAKGGNTLPAEEYFDLKEIAHVGLEAREKIGEISRLAVDPMFQGSDILVAIFKNILVETGRSKIQYTFCSATPDLGAYYAGVGARKKLGPIPHPSLQDSTLSLYMFDSDQMIDGSMNSLAWFRVAKPALLFLSTKGFIRSPSRGFKHYLLFPFQAAKLMYARARRKRLKKQLTKKNRAA